MRLNWTWSDISKTDVSKSIFLNNCSLVIDGQNFFHEKYEQSELPYEFGAEADRYAKYLREQLQMFKDANVECYIVFKGGDTDINKKIDNLWSTNFDFESNYRFVAPVFMKEIHQQVLDEVGVKYATCVMESKDDCVELAQVLECPVLSKDKEFFFKGVPYIPYTTIDYTATQKFITCQQYHQKELFQKYSLSDKKAAIFLALSDGDVFPKNYFKNLVKEWNLKGWYLYPRLKEILNWLSKHSEFKAMKSILKLFSTEFERNTFLSCTRVVLEKKYYRDGGVLTKYLLNTCKLNELLPSSYDDDSRWFDKGVASQKIAIPYINLYKHKCIMGSWAIEKNNNCKDSIMLSIDIIKYAYNLLSNFQRSEITVYQTFEEYTKVNTEYYFEKPTYQSTESVFENGWNDIKGLELFDHFLVTNNINTGIINEFPADARLLFIALAFFDRKKASEQIQVTKEVYCFIVSYVMLNVIFDEQDSIRKKENNISENDCDAAILVTKKYFGYSKSEAMQIFDENTLKTLVELQYCLLHMNYLNALCGSSFLTTKYHRTFNGTFIYKLFKDMDACDVQLFFDELFKTAPSVLEFVNTLISTYKKLVL